MFGQFDEQGNLREDVTVCVLSGRAIEPGDVMYRFSGTPYFVRIKADEFRNFTEDVRLALATQLPREALSAMDAEEQPRRKRGEN